MIGCAHVWFERVWNQRDESAIDELMAPNAWTEGFDPTGARISSRDEFKAVYRDYLNKFPEARVSVEYVAVEGDTVVCWLLCSALARPGAFGLSGEAKQVCFTAVAWGVLKDGIFQGGRNLVDVASILNQLQD